MKHLLFIAFAVACFLAIRQPAQAACTVAHTFVTGEVLTASNLNANPANEVNCINNVTIVATQIQPTNTTDATFGGTATYTFPVNVIVNAGVFASSSGSVGLCASSSCAGKLTLTTAGAMTTTGTQACGTPAGYHVECGSESASCAGNTYCTSSAVNFTTAFSSAPNCQVTALNTGSGRPIGMVDTVSTIQVVPSIYNAVVGSYAGTIYYMCVGK